MWRFSYWSSYKKQLKICLALCKTCLKFRWESPMKRGKMRSVANKTAAPNKILSVDLTGLHLMSTGYRFCFMAQDLFTKHLFLQPLGISQPNQLSLPWWRSSWMRVIMIVKSDLGKEFVNQISEELYWLTGSNHVTAYSPNQNPVESCHRTLNAIIEKLVDRHAS